MDAYTIAAFYDLLAAPARAPVCARIVAALGNLPEGPILDVGAGTGLSTAALVAAFPQRSIIALEPDSAMRTALMTRLAIDPARHQQVTVLPCAFGAAVLPVRVAGCVLAASLVHFNPQARAQLWHWLATSLCPGGRAVIELQCSSAQAIPDTRFAEQMMGAIRYEGWMRAEVVDDSRVEWRITYASWQDATRLETVASRFLCHASSIETLTAELARLPALRFGFDGDLLWIERVPIEDRAASPQ